MTLRWQPATTIGAQVSWRRHGKGDPTSRNAAPCATVGSQALLLRTTASRAVPAPLTPVPWTTRIHRSRRIQHRHPPKHQWPILSLRLLPLAQRMWHARLWRRLTVRRQVPVPRPTRTGQFRWDASLRGRRSVVLPPPLSRSSLSVRWLASSASDRHSDQAQSLQIGPPLPS